MIKINRGCNNPLFLMSKFYPRGTFGPVCDIQPSDDTLRNRPRRLPEDDDDDRIETIPIDIDFPDIINDFDPPPPYLIGRKCKRRELPDGTIEYYDCIDEYTIDYPGDPDLIDRITDVTDLFPLDPIRFVPEVTPLHVLLLILISIFFHNILLSQMEVEG